VSIPIRMYTAASSAGVSFNQLHAKCGTGSRAADFCPVCNEVVDRAAARQGLRVPQGAVRPASPTRS
jgi:non-homologous end joining protein Ku